MTIINAEIHTVTNGVISPGFIEFKDGKITCLGEMKDYHGDADVYDAQGRYASSWIYRRSLSSGHVGRWSRL